jgi:hypothetical protein
VLSRFLDTVSECIIDGGVFIGTTMDGEETYNLLKGKDRVELKKCYSLEKFYVDDDQIELGKKIKIHLDDTIVSEQYEYLVFFEIFQKELEKRGFVLVESSLFQPPDSLTDKIKILSGLFRSFVFKKVGFNLNPLEPDESFTISNQFVRTGVVPDRNTFFHSVLRCIYPVYINSPLESRIDIAYKAKSNIIESITMDVWKNKFNEWSYFHSYFERKGWYEQLSDFRGNAHSFRSEQPWLKIPCM